MKIEILITVVFLSLLHGLVPSHWAPVMAMKKQYKWNTKYTLKIVSVLTLAHILSTVFIGIVFLLVGSSFTSYLDSLFKNFSINFFSSLVLLLLGIYFIYRHYYHHHFHLHNEDKIIHEKSIRKQLYLLVIGMIFSPCTEIAGIYFIGGMLNWYYVLIITLIYFILSYISSIFWVFSFDILSKKINFHQLEHNSGLLSGFSLIISAVLIYFI